MMSSRQRAAALWLLAGVAAVSAQDPTASPSSSPTPAAASNTRPSGGPAVGEAVCTLCPDGSTAFAVDRVVPFLVLPSDNETRETNPTCGDLASFILENPELECEFIQSEAGYCGCPGITPPAESCTFCPDGTDPPNADTLTASGDTCADLALWMSFIPLTQCAESDRVKGARGFDFVCGCPGAEPPCTLCPDGSTDYVADRVVPLFSLSDSDGSRNADPTCGDLAQFVADNPAVDCSMVQQEAGYCGCPNMEAVNQCSFCPNGDAPGLPQKETPSGDTCADLALWVAYSDQCDSTRTKSINRRGFLCDCPNATKPSCQLCQDGSAATKPDVNITLATREMTCAAAQDFITTLSPDACFTLMGGSFDPNLEWLCGCPNARPPCTLCPDGSTDFAQDRVIPLFTLSTPNTGKLQDPTCGQVANWLLDHPDYNCASIQAESGYCGCPGLEPENACSFCPAGASVPTPEKTTPSGDACGDLELWMSYIKEEDCKQGRVTSAQGFDFFCDCPAATADCLLCPNGDAPADPDLMLPHGDTCGNIADLASALDTERCKNLTDLLTADAIRCGCDGVDDSQFPVCQVRRNAPECTIELLDSTQEECECYSFCGANFFACENWPANATLAAKYAIDSPCEDGSNFISGCNRALALANANGSAPSGNGGSGGTSGRVHWSLAVLLAATASSLLFVV